MAHPSELHRLQSLFWRLVSAPEGVEKGAQELCRQGVLESADLSFLVRPEGRLGPVERLDIYADMYFYRLRDCLAEDFPRLAERLGPARFHNLVTDYLLAHPPRHFSLRELGRALPGFLESHPPTEAFPAVADLARLEWARVDVFDAADASPLTRQEILERAGAAPDAFAMTLIPAARLLRVHASIPSLWEGEGDETSSRKNGDCALLVWRKGFSVLHRALPDDEAACVQALASGGATPAELGERLLAQQEPDAPPERSARRLAELLDRWARDAVLARHAKLEALEPTAGLA